MINEEAGMPALVDILPNHRFDVAALTRYLRERLPGFDGDVRIRQFQGGQSNPTYRINAGTHTYVLRKKPSGKLAPSAHAVEREYAVMSALSSTEVPVPAMRLLCTDESVIGQTFVIMDYVPGRVFSKRDLPGIEPADRASIYDAAVKTLATLHRIDHRSVGLGEYGRPDGYVARTLSRWSRQYEQTKVEENAAMDNVIAWLQRHVPTRERTSIVHGDCSLGNFIFHPVAPQAVALIDWELSTIGHPLADLAYFCIGYHLPPDDPRGLGNVDYRALGIPDEEAVVAAYSRYVEDDVTDWSFFLILSMFRMAAIRVGILRRAMDGNAADADALAAGARYRGLADATWHMARALQ